MLNTLCSGGDQQARGAQCSANQQQGHRCEAAVKGGSDEHADREKDRRHGKHDGHLGPTYTEQRLHRLEENRKRIDGAEGQIHHGGRRQHECPSADASCSG